MTTAVALNCILFSYRLWTWTWCGFSLLCMVCCVVMQFLQISRTCDRSDCIPQHVHLRHGIILHRWNSTVCESFLL